MSFFDFLKSKTYLGIDLGTASVKIIELSKSGKQFKLENYGYIQTLQYKQSLKYSGSNLQPTTSPEEEEKKIIEEIKKLLAASKITTKNATFGLSSNSTFLSVIELPLDIPEKELAEAIPFEAKQHVPVPIEDVVLGWEILQQKVVKEKNLYQDKEQSRWEILLVATHKSIIEKNNRIAEACGLNLMAPEMEALASARTLLPNKDDHGCIIDIGYRNTDISIVHQGVTRLSRSIEISSDNITQALAHAFGVDYRRAEKFKLDTGLSNVESGDEVSSTIIPIIDQILDESQKTIQLFNYSFPQQPVTKIYLAGATANMPGLPEYVKSHLKLSTTVGNPWAKMLIPNGLQPVLKKLGPSFAVAIGLAMRELT